MKYAVFSEETYNDLKKLLNTAIVSGEILFENNTITVPLYRYAYAKNGYDGFEDTELAIIIHLHDQIGDLEGYVYPFHDQIMNDQNRVTYVNRLLYIIKRDQIQLVC